MTQLVSSAFVLIRLHHSDWLFHFMAMIDRFLFYFAKTLDLSSIRFILNERSLVVASIRKNCYNHSGHKTSLTKTITALWGGAYNPHTTGFIMFDSLSSTSNWIGSHGKMKGAVINQPFWFSWSILNFSFQNAFLKLSLEYIKDQR